MRTYISLDPDGLLSHTRSLSTSLRILTLPQHLEEIYDHWMTFTNVREFRAHLFATLCKGSHVTIALFLPLPIHATLPPPPDLVGEPKESDRFLPASQ